jgi:hypothetical protein
MMHCLVSHCPDKPVRVTPLRSPIASILALLLNVSCGSRTTLEAGEACGAACQTGLDTAAGCQPSIVADAQFGPNTIAANGSSVFWTTFGHGQAGEASLMKREIGGGGAVALATGQTAVQTFTIDETSVFWVTGEPFGSQRIMTIQQDGGTPRPLGSASTVSQLVIRGSYLYWTEYFTVKRMPVTGGDFMTLASDRADARGLAVDDTDVYWTEFGVPTRPAGLFKVPIAGGKPVLLTDALFSPWGIAMDASWIYVAAFESQGREAIWRVPKPGGAPILLFVDDNLNPWRLIVDGSRLYFSAQGAIKALHLGTDDFSFLDTPVPIFDLALNAKNVFFTFIGAGDDAKRMTDGSVWMTCKLP